MKRPAFTLIEVIVVVVIVALISSSLAIVTSRSRSKALFKDTEVQLTHLIQEARSSALSNLEIDNESASYYLLELSTSSATLTGYNELLTSTELDSLTYESGITLDDDYEIYYFPPDATVCFTAACSESYTYITMTLSSTGTDYESSITVSSFGGFPEVE